ASVADAAPDSRPRGAWRLELHEAADRRHSGRDQRPGPDQHAGRRLLTARDRATHYVSYRDGTRGPAGARLHAIAVALWAFAGHGRLQGRYRHLLCPPAGGRSTPAGAFAAARGDG